MTYSHKEILESVKSTLKPGTTFDNKNIGGTTVHTVTENDRFAMFGNGVVLGLNGGTDKLILVYKDGKIFEMTKDAEELYNIFKNEIMVKDTILG